jgi:aryl-alcohol dehydrogenase-like predicted oxidoreductase
MQKRKLGKSNLEVSALGFGCMGLSFGYGPASDKKEAIALIRSAVERGVTFFDTAEVYGPFTNEELVGEALAPFRNKVVIATKFGFSNAPEGNAAGLEVGIRTHQGSRRSLAQAPQGPRSSTCSISIGLIRKCRSKKWQERSKGFDSARQSQTLRSFEAAVKTIRRAHVINRLRHRKANIHSVGESEAEVLPTLEELGIGFVPFSPLWQGLPDG